jgi:fatty acid desaturase
MTDEQPRKREEKERLEAEERSEAERRELERDFKREGVVWWTITGIFVVLWALGLVTGAGGAIHLLLLIALMLVVERWGSRL